MTDNQDEKTPGRPSDSDGKQCGSNIASAIVKSLEETWISLRRRHKQVPRVVVTLWPSSAAAVKWHHVQGQWKSVAEETVIDEVRISAEGLQDGAEATIARLVDQAMVAYIKYAHGRQPTNYNRYRARIYKSNGNAFGLLVEYVGPPHGWVLKGLSPAGRIRYAADIERLEAAITAYRLPHIQDDGWEFHSGSGTSATDKEGSEMITEHINDETGRRTEATSDETTDDTGAAGAKPTGFGTKGDAQLGGRGKYRKYDKQWRGFGDREQNQLVGLRCDCPDPDGVRYDVHPVDPTRWIQTKVGELARGSIVCGRCGDSFSVSTESSRPVFLEDEGIAEWEEELIDGNWTDHGMWKAFKAAHQLKAAKERQRLNRSPRGPRKGGSKGGA